MAKRKKYMPIVVIILFMVVSVCEAEPTPTIIYLMNEPASMFDIGMMRLNTKLKWKFDYYDFHLKHVKTHIIFDGVGYWEDTNRIIIDIKYHLIIREDDITPFKELQEYSIKDIKAKIEEWKRRSRRLPKTSE